MIEKATSQSSQTPGKTSSPEISDEYHHTPLKRRPSKLRTSIENYEAGKAVGYGWRIEGPIFPVRTYNANDPPTKQGTRP